MKKAVADDRIEDGKLCGDQIPCRFNPLVPGVH